MIADPERTGRTQFDIGDIVQKHRQALEASVKLTHQQKRVLSAIELCRTSALGGHIDVCHACGYEQPSYNSCRNRHCPKCQALAQEQWIKARRERLLPVGHFHVVFTLPSQLRALAKYRPQKLYGALFSAASETLIELGQSRLKAQLGVTMVLHTWSRDLRYHPHVHAIVTGGGLALDGQSFIRSGGKYLFPGQVMSLLFRGKMMAKLRDLERQGDLAGYEGFCDPEGFEHLMQELSRIRWVVYAKRPFGQVGHVLEYLGRYTHRVAIANSRLTDVTDDVVTFRTKDGKSCTLTPVTFLRRFIQHVLPSGFHKIRHYGLYSSQMMRPGGKLAQAREALAVEPEPEQPSKPKLSGSYEAELQEVTGRDVTHCPQCGSALEQIPVPPLRLRPP